MSYSRKVERLLESKRPSLSILLEDMSPDDKKGLKKEKNDIKKEPKKPEPASKSSSSSKPKKDKEEKFDFGNFDFEEEDKDEETEKTKADDEEKDDEGNKEEIEKIKDTLAKKIELVYGGLPDRFTSDAITNKIFTDDITEGIFKKVGLSNSFRLQEKKIFSTNKKILKEFSINDKVGDIDLSVELLVDNAINLTKNFEDLIDIPNLILTQISAKFAEKAIEDENENAGSEYRVKLEEFIEKYMSKLKTIDNYKNYDTSKYVISHNPQRPVATGARPST
jgi:hypothetical protein